MPELMLFLAGLLMFAILTVVVCLQAIQSANELAKEAVRAQTRALESALIIRGGLNPHVANPTLFGPSGMARTDEEKATAAAPPPPGDFISEEERAIREAEEEYFKAAGIYNPDGSRVNNASRNH